jgi:hypothetical protein
VHFLGASSAFSVSVWLDLREKHHRDTENSEVAQRSKSKIYPTFRNFREFGRPEVWERREQNSR